MQPLSRQTTGSSTPGVTCSISLIVQTPTGPPNATGDAPPVSLIACQRGRRVEDPSQVSGRNPRQRRVGPHHQRSADLNLNPIPAPGIEVSGQASQEVARLLAGGLGRARRWQQWFGVPSTPAIAKARARLGAEPLRRLFAEVAGPLATPATKGAWYRGWRVLAVDGTCLDVADTPANEQAFGRPKTHRGERTAFPQARVVGVAECGTHAIVNAALGPLASGETTLAPALFASLGPGMLLLADRLFVGAALWRQAQATGAELVWRTRTNAVLPVLETFADGSYCSQITAATDRRQRIAPTVLRVVEYTLGKDRGRPAQPAPYRLVTTILDPAQAPAAELAALYHQRWEFETALAELKTHQRGPRAVLRSKSPEMVAQEVWGMLLVHHAIRRLMHQAALDHEVDPDRLSFVRSLRIVRRQVTITGQVGAAIPPEPQARTLERVIGEIAERLLPTRRLRAFARVVKRKMRELRRQARQASRLATPDASPAQAVVIVGASNPLPIRRPPGSRVRRRAGPRDSTTSTEPAEQT
jgi:hypothetical protein